MDLKPKQRSHMVHLKGVPFSGGLARGSAYVNSDILESKQVSYHVEGDQIESEWRRIQDARDAVKGLLMESAKRIQRAMGKDFFDIFLAQASMLSDPQLNADLEGGLRKKQINAERVVGLVFQEWSRIFRAAPSAVLSQRADDVEDLLRRMLGVLAGVQFTPLSWKMESKDTGEFVLVLSGIWPACRGSSDWGSDRP